MVESMLEPRTVRVGDPVYYMGTWQEVYLNGDISPDREIGYYGTVKSICDCTSCLSNGDGPVARVITDDGLCLWPVSMLGLRVKRLFLDVLNL